MPGRSAVMARAWGNGGSAAYEDWGRPVSWPDRGMRAMRRGCVVVMLADGAGAAPSGHLGRLGLSGAVRREDSRRPAVWPSTWARSSSEISPVTRACSACSSWRLAEAGVPQFPFGLIVEDPASSMTPRNGRTGRRKATSAGSCRPCGGCGGGEVVGGHGPQQAQLDPALPGPCQVLDYLPHAGFLAGAGQERGMHGIEFMGRLAHHAGHAMPVHDLRQGPVSRSRLAVIAALMIWPSSILAWRVASGSTPRIWSANDL